VQPNNVQSGTNQEPAVGQALVNSAGNQALPSVDPTNLGVPPTIPSPNLLPNTSVSATGPAIEEWVHRIEGTVITQPNPRKRAEVFAQLKTDYQQNVLGLKPKQPGEPKQ
jgi:hypothetical protein